MKGWLWKSMLIGSLSVAVPAQAACIGELSGGGRTGSLGILIALLTAEDDAAAIQVGMVVTTEGSGAPVLWRIHCARLNSDDQLALGGATLYAAAQNAAGDTLYLRAVERGAGIGGDLVGISRVPAGPNDGLCGAEHIPVQPLDGELVSAHRGEHE